MMYVQNMKSPRTGKPVANQFILGNDGEVLFQSYKSPIVAINYNKNEITIYRDFDYSVTTRKYRNRFMEIFGFSEMATSKGFRECMENGACRGFAIVYINA